MKRRQIEQQLAEERKQREEIARWLAGLEEQPRQARKGKGS